MHYWTEHPSRLKNRALLEGFPPFRFFSRQSCSPSPLSIANPPRQSPSSETLLAAAGSLVKGVGAGSPVGEEQAQANSLEDAGQSADGNGVEWAPLREDLRDEL